jgi:hypothetical protein
MDPKKFPEIITVNDWNIGRIDDCNNGYNVTIAESIVAKDIEHRDAFLQNEEEFLAYYAEEEIPQVKQSFAELRKKNEIIKRLLAMKQAGLSIPEGEIKKFPFTSKDSLDRLPNLDSLIEEIEGMDEPLKATFEENLVDLRKWADELRTKIDNGKNDAE